MSHSTTKMATMAPAAARLSPRRHADRDSIVRAAAGLGFVGVQPDQDGREGERRDHREVRKLGPAAARNPTAATAATRDGGRVRCGEPEPLPP